MRFGGAVLPLNTAVARACRLKMAGDSKIDLAGLSRRTIGDRSSIVGIRATIRHRLATNFAVDLANDLSFSLGVVRRSFGVTDRSFASNGKA